MVNVSHALDAYYGGKVVAWVDASTTPQGRLQTVTLTVLPGYVCSWFLVDESGTKWEGTLSNPVGATTNMVQSWNANNAGITSYSAGIGAESLTA